MDRLFLDLIAWLSAPFAILVNGLFYLYSILVIAFIRHDPIRVKTSEKRLGIQIKEGLRWVYKHEFLRTLDLNTHVWFLFHSMIGTALITFAPTELGFNASTLGLVLSATGIGAVLGSTLLTSEEALGTWSRYSFFTFAILSCSHASPLYL